MGRLSVRLPESLHHQLATQAHHEGVSLNQYLVYLLAQRAAAYSVRVVAEDEVARQEEGFSQLLEELGPTSHEQIRAALDGREAGEPEAGLTPELVEWFEERIQRSGVCQGSQSKA